MAESNHDEMSIFFFLTEIHIEYKTQCERKTQNVIHNLDNKRYLFRESTLNDHPEPDCGPIQPSSINGSGLQILGQYSVSSPYVPGTTGN